MNSLTQFFSEADCKGDQYFVEKNNRPILGPGAVNLTDVNFDNRASAFQCFIALYTVIVSMQPPLVFSGLGMAAGAAVHQIFTDLKVMHPEFALPIPRNSRQIVHIGAVCC